MTNATDAPADRRDLGWLLTSFARRVPNIVGALAVTMDGLAIAASDQVGSDQVESLAIITSGLANLSVNAAKVLSTGHARHTVVHMDGGAMLVMSLAGMALLAVLVPPGANLDQVAYETAALAQGLINYLEQAPRIAAS